MQQRGEKKKKWSETVSLHNTLLIEKHLGIMMEVLLSGSVVKRKRGLSRFPRQPTKEREHQTDADVSSRPASLGKQSAAVFI
ncbi:hypothetical protein CesoFtcFv8_009737 [Champsocephalus esox]|uniref:Uncharacterized protein n=2 Tax=Champsocephalus TaxID=52236 RepID=A0AAN8DLU2_CHAGU|nr:hypothetical protein CesoFtcFv8_009737 [Champsocephalus esox]KAK5924632.1 hypothetical protein CgunFtcFv8_017228 [Champsocephalus gunnari]